MHIPVKQNIEKLKFSPNHSLNAKGVIMMRINDIVTAKTMDKIATFFVLRFTQTISPRAIASPLADQSGVLIMLAIRLISVAIFVRME